MFQFESRRIRALTYPARISICLHPPKDTYTSGTLTETRHYYYTPGWQCVEERTGTLTTVERQFVWGLRYIDDLVLRDRSTANNGTINERRYAMQDGNWNTIAICDITGSVSERYAYSAYGTPVFMIGAGVVQTSSPIGFETLYAGYRWDGTTPQMYYVRNRFLLPMIGTWNRRDRLGYVAGDGNLLAAVRGRPLVAVDPTGAVIIFTNRQETTEYMIALNKAGIRFVVTYDPRTHTYFIRADQSSIGNVFPFVDSRFPLPENFHSLEAKRGRTQ